MKTLHLKTSSTSPTTRRRGVTLTEVLMSLMIMSIGVVSLATLFPISTLRVLEATNLTNSAIARFNAEGIVDSFDTMIHNPDGISTTREGGRNYVVDPLGWYELLAQTGTPPTVFEYNRPPAGSPFEVTLPVVGQQTRYLGDNVASPVLFTSIDVARQIATLPDTTTDFGEGFPDPDGTNPSAYIVNGDGLLTGLVMPPEVDLTVFTLPTTDPAYQNPTQYQALIFDVTGDFSEIRTIESVAGQQINWPSRPLPARFSSLVGLVRIERVDPYYSWMLTVRKRASGPANVDVVVFSKRDFSELSEQVYVGDLRRFTLGNNGVPGFANGETIPTTGSTNGDDNQDSTPDDPGEIGYPGSDDQQNNRVLVDWDPSLYDPANPPEKPPLRRGGYVYDTANALWYRILSIEEAPTATSAILALDKAISRNNTEDVIPNNSIDPGEDRNNDGVLDRGGLIIPRGVIGVFPLETKLLQQ